VKDESIVVNWNGETHKATFTDLLDGTKMVKMVMNYKDWTPRELRIPSKTCDVMGDRKSRRASKRGRWETQQAYAKRMRKAANDYEPRRREKVSKTA